MKKNIWRLLQIAWLVLAMITAHNSIRALTNDVGYCAGMNCDSDRDCIAPCRCYSLDFMCYYLENPQSNRFGQQTEKR